MHICIAAKGFGDLKMSFFVPCILLGELYYSAAGHNLRQEIGRKCKEILLFFKSELLGFKFSTF